MYLQYLTTFSLLFLGALSYPAPSNGNDGSVGIQQHQLTKPDPPLPLHRRELSTDGIRARSPFSFGSKNGDKKSGTKRPKKSIFKSAASFVKKSANKMFHNGQGTKSTVADETAPGEGTGQGAAYGGATGEDSNALADQEDPYDRPTGESTDDQYGTGSGYSNDGGYGTNEGYSRGDGPNEN